MGSVSSGGWDVRSTHIFRIFQDEEEETEDLSARLLVQTTEAGEAEEHFRFKVHGGILNHDIWARDLTPLGALRPFRLRYETRGGAIDLRTNTTASAYEDVVALAANGALSAYVGSGTEDKTADFLRLMGEAKELDPEVGFSIRWAVRAAGATKIKLVLEGLPAPAKKLRRDSRLNSDLTPGVLLKSWPLTGPMATSGLSGPIPVLFSARPEETKNRLDRDPTALKTGKPF
jgi:hypothetical protein